MTGLQDKKIDYTEIEKMRRERNEPAFRITSEELPKYLKAYHAVFAKVRLLEGDCLSYRMADEQGNLGCHQKQCFEIWEKDKRCENCISHKSMQTKHNSRKFEVFKNEIYFIISEYIEVDGEPRVIEMLTTVGNDVLNGFEENPSLLNAISKINHELYRDVQLDIYNRRFFEEQIKRLTNITAVAMVDLDHFKAINDTYGHAVGDVTLQAVAKAIRENIREDDVVIRFGGDELMIAFKGMRESNLYSKLEQIRMAVKQQQIVGYPEMQVTVSLGGYYCGKYEDTAVEKADRALYEAKKTRDSAFIMGQNATRKKSTADE